MKNIFHDEYSGQFPSETLSKCRLIGLHCWDRGSFDLLYCNVIFPKLRLLHKRKIQFQHNEADFSVSSYATSTLSSKCTPHKILCLSICFATCSIPPRFICFLMSTLNGRKSNEELSMSHKLNILIYFFPFEVVETWGQCSRCKMQLISIASRWTATAGAGFHFRIECCETLLNSIFLFFFPSLTHRIAVGKSKINHNKTKNHPHHLPHHPFNHRLPICDVFIFWFYVCFVVD